MLDSIDAYLHSLLESVAASPLIHSSSVLFDKRTQQSGFLRGDLYFSDNSRLHFRELIEIQNSVVRLMYSYHYQKGDGTLIFRYDDTPHHKHLPNFPHHKHVFEEGHVISAEPPNLSSVLKEIEKLSSS
jgi:hypothetical protein